MYENILKAEIIHGKKKNQTFFIKMLILRCQKPIRISGHGVFVMSAEYFRKVGVNILLFNFYKKLILKNLIFKMVFHTYQFYSSMITLKE